MEDGGLLREATRLETRVYKGGTKVSNEFEISHSSTTGVDFRISADFCIATPAEEV